MSEWRVLPANQPRPADYSYNVDEVLASIVGLHSFVPADAFTAETLGTERGGNGVVIDDGLILTIGYLITEAEQVWLHLADGRVMEGHALGFDAADRLRAGAGARPAQRRTDSARLVGVGRMSATAS